MDLKSPVGATLLKTRGVGTILDDDASTRPPVRSFTRRLRRRPRSRLSGHDRLQWVNPVGGNPVEIRIRFTKRLGCTPPLDPDATYDGLLQVFPPDIGAPGEPRSLDHKDLDLDTSYCYTIWVIHSGGAASVGVSATGRPFDATGLLRWKYSTSTGHDGRGAAHGRARGRALGRQRRRDPGDDALGHGRSVARRTAGLEPARARLAVPVPQPDRAVRGRLALLRHDAGRPRPFDRQRDGRARLVARARACGHERRTRRHLLGLRRAARRDLRGHQHRRQQRDARARSRDRRPSRVLRPAAQSRDRADPGDGGRRLFHESATHLLRDAARHRSRNALVRGARATRTARLHAALEARGGDISGSVVLRNGRVYVGTDRGRGAVGARERRRGRRHGDARRRGRPRFRVPGPGEPGRLRLDRQHGLPPRRTTSPTGSPSGAWR